MAGEDARFLEYLMLNWRISLLNIYLNGELDRQEELERAINRCSIIMSMLREGGGDAARSVLVDQLSRLASELGDIVEEGEEKEDRGIGRRRPLSTPRRRLIARARSCHKGYKVVLGDPGSGQVLGLFLG